MPWSSNATYLCEVRCGDDVMRAIYKPRRGERPLWDFPSGLDHREVAAYELSQALGWDLVPAHHPARRPARAWARCRRSSTPTSSSTTSRSTRTRRTTTPCGRCARSTSSATTPTARAATSCSASTVASAGIDHGLMFHHEFKLRTVIWEFGGEPIPDPLLTAADRARRRRSCPIARRAARPLRAGRRAHPGPSPGGRRATSRSTRRAAATPGRSSRRERLAVVARSGAPLPGEQHDLVAVLDAADLLASEPGHELRRRAAAG